MLKKGGILVSIAGDPDPATFAARGVKRPLREAAKAHQRSEGGHSRGKIVLTAE